MESFKAASYAFLPMYARLQNLLSPPHCLNSEFECMLSIKLPRPYVDKTE
jgi:hypothetical protein